MKRLKTIAVIGLSLLMMSALTVPALAADDYGSSAVKDSGVYTVEQMLTYAIEDEYMAQAEYSAILDAYGVARPFTNIMKAETVHIAELEKLFTAYGYVLPENTAAARVTLPADLETAFNTGIQAEQNNIAMYDVFLSNTLPDDVRIVFEALKTASEYHLTAFERGLARPGAGTNAGAGNGYGASGQNGGASAANGYGSGTGTGVCDGTGLSNGTAAGSGYRGAGRGSNAQGAGTGVCILG